MIEFSEEKQPVYPAATIVLVRDGEPGLEVLLVQRSEAVRHMGGMWVFPGGRVDDADEPEDRNELQAALNAAVREIDEEAGLVLTPQQLVPMSHWTTPEGARRRFATWFFLATLEDDQQVKVDGGEISHHEWRRPGDVLAAVADPENPFKLMPPTYISLLDLIDHSDCDAVSAALREREPIMFAPRMVMIEGGICFLYAGDAGYESMDIDGPGPRHRTYLVDEQLQYIREL